MILLERFGKYEVIGETKLIKKITTLDKRNKGTIHPSNRDSNGTMHHNLTYYHVKLMLYNKRMELIYIITYDMKIQTTKDM